jgi:hypothetical protein
VTVEEIQQAKDALKRAIERSMRDFIEATGYIPSVTIYNDVEEINHADGTVSLTTNTEVDVELRL